MEYAITCFNVQNMRHATCTFRIPLAQPPASMLSIVLWLSNDASALPMHANKLFLFSLLMPSNASNDPSMVFHNKDLHHLLLCSTHVLRCQMLCLSRDAALLRHTMCPLFTTMQEVTILFRNATRIVLHLGSHLINGPLEVSLLG